MKSKTSPKVEITDKEIKKTHSAFGLVSFHRFSGNCKTFGSEINSNVGITLQIHEAEEVWHLHEKNYFARKLVAKVELSPHQFATLLTTMNMGSGVPCTIKYNNGEVEDFIDSDTTHDLIQKDLKEDVSDLSISVKKLETEMKEILEKSTLSKANKKVLLGIVSQIRIAIDSNIPFILKQYREALDKMTSGAKAEVDAFVTNALTQLGMEKLGELKKLEK